MSSELFKYLAQKPIKINRDDIEQALSWYSRLSFADTTQKDTESFNRLLNITLKMRALGIDE